MIEINLIPDVKSELLKAQSLRNFIISISSIVVIASIAITVLISLTVFVAQPLLIGAKDNEIKSTFSELENTQNIKSTVTLQNQLNQIDSLYAESPVTSRIIGQIATAIQPGGENTVTFSSLDYSTEAKALIIEGEAQNGFPALETFRKTISETKILYREEAKNESCTASDLLNENSGCKSEDLADQEVSTIEQSFGDNDDGVKVLRFKISISLNKSVLSSSSKDVAILPPGRKDVTDSKTQIPDDIFKARAKDDKEEK